MITHKHNKNETYLAIREQTLEEALKGDGLINIVVADKEYVRSARDWMETGRLSLQRFKFETPMKLYWNDLNKTQDTKQLSLFNNLG